MAYDYPLDKTLPGLSAGYGWQFMIGIMPFTRGGVSVNVNSTIHDFDAGVSGNRVVEGDSRRTAIGITAHWRFASIRSTDFESYLGAGYYSVGGGDSSGGYVEYPDFDKDQIGYSGWGLIFGAGVVHPIATRYFLQFNIRANMLKYGTYHFIDLEYEVSRPGNSIAVNLGIIYRIDFSRF